MRTSTGVLYILCIFFFLGSLMFTTMGKRRSAQNERLNLGQRVVADLALSDLALSTEARYTRHPAVTDAVVVGMDHPDALDHFPSTLFFAPVR